MPCYLLFLDYHLMSPQSLTVHCFTHQREPSPQNFRCPVSWNLSIQKGSSLKLGPSLPGQLATFLQAQRPWRLSCAGQASMRKRTGDLMEMSFMRRGCDVNGKPFSCQDYGDKRKSVKVEQWWYIYSSHLLLAFAFFTPQFLLLSFLSWILALSFEWLLPSLLANSFRIQCHLPLEVLPMLLYLSHVLTHVTDMEPWHPDPLARKDLPSCQ